MKKMLGLLLVLVMGAITHASDNRSAPNVFSSGSTISSSQMNENFNFLSSEIREKNVYCNNGETISDAINEGYNSLTIYGACDGGVMVYKYDPTAFGVSSSQMLNKPITHLIIKGGEANRVSTITNTAGTMESGAISKGFLQLSNLTFNDTLNANYGSVIFLNEVNYEATNIEASQDEDDQAYSKITSYNNSYLSIENSTIDGAVKVYDGSVVSIKDSTLNTTDNYDKVLLVNRNSIAKTDKITMNGRIGFFFGSSWNDYKSTINCTTNSSCISFKASNVSIEDTRINLLSNSGSAVDVTSSYVNFYTPVVDCVSEYSCFDVTRSNFVINLSNNYEGKFEVKSNSGQAFNLKVSTLNLKEATIDCSSNYACFNLEKSELFTDNVNINLSEGENIAIGNNNSLIELNNSIFSCPLNNTEWKQGCVRISYNSVSVISETSISTENTFGIEAQWNSNIQVNNATINRADSGSQIHLNAHSNLQIQSGTQDLNLDCGSQTFLQNQTSLNISGGCTEY